MQEPHTALVLPCVTAKKRFLSFPNSPPTIIAKVQNPILELATGPNPPKAPYDCHFPAIYYC